MSRSEGKPPTVADSTMLDDRPQAQPKKRLDDLPTMSRERYDIAGEHARGGLGVILRARDQNLERTVAIKEIGANADERSSTRFVREALITARLQHPGIVPVYEAGRWPNGARFYAMKMVSGKTLREELKARAELEDRLALVPNVLAVAEAVGYAHAEGVIHRDLKPDNVMVGAFGETVVVDWGLAKDRRLGGEAPQPGLYAQTHAEATHIGAVIGTPAYMSPEQARGEDVDERADVWAIGAILYHLLAAQPPYVGAPDSVIERVAKEAAPPLADRAPGAPRDLIAIVNKAMARDPAARYANAKELAGDLSRFLTGQLVGAREYNRLARIEHWVKQHRAPVIVAAILLAILAMTATLSIVRILDERRVAQNRSDELLLTQASSQLDRDPTAAIAWIKQYPKDGADQEAARNIAADASSRGVARHVWRGNPEEVNALALSPDGKVVATASGKTLQLFERAGGVRLARVDIPGLFFLRFSPDGRTLVGTAEDGTVITVDTTTFAVRQLGRALGVVQRIVFAPDGKTFVTGDTKGGLWQWSLAGAPPRRLFQYDGVVVEIAVTDGGVTSFGYRDGRLVVHRTTLGTSPGDVEIAELGSNEIGESAISVDGTTFVGAFGETVLRWHDGDTTMAEVARMRAPVVKIAIARDGRVVAGGADGSLVILVPGVPARSLGGHYHAITAIAFDATSDAFASGDDAGDVRVWGPMGVDELHGHVGKIQGLELGHDGVVTAGHDGSARAWTKASRGTAIPLSVTDAFRVIWTGADRVLTTHRDGSVNLVDLATGKVQQIGGFERSSYDIERFSNGDIAVSAWNGAMTVFGNDGTPKAHVETNAQIWHVAVSPDGQQVASASANGEVRLWRVTSNATTVADTHVGQALDVAFAPDGRALVTSGEDPELHVVDLATGTKRSLHASAGNMMSLVFAADGRTVYSGGDQGEVRGWDLASGSSRLFAGHEGRVRTVALSKDERFLASGDVDGTIVVWDLAEGARARVLAGHTAEARHVAFSPRGHLLASAGWDGTVRLWNLDDGRVTIWRGHQGKVHRVAFAPDGRRVASVAEDGTVRVWSVDDQVAIPQEHDALIEWTKSVTTAVIDDTHRQVITPQ